MGKEKKGVRESQPSWLSFISFEGFVKIENMCLTNLTAHFSVHRSYSFLKF